MAAAAAVGFVDENGVGPLVVVDDSALRAEEVGVYIDLVRLPMGLVYCYQQRGRVGSMNCW